MNRRVKAAYVRSGCAGDVSAIVMNGAVGAVRTADKSVCDGRGGLHSSRAVVMSRAPTSSLSFIPAIQRQEWHHREDVAKVGQQVASGEEAGPIRRVYSETGHITPDPGSAKFRHRQSTKARAAAVMRTAQRVRARYSSSTRCRNADSGAAVPLQRMMN